MKGLTQKKRNPSKEIDLIAFVAHELKNPLASCLMNAYMLKDGLLGELNERQQKAVASLVRNLEYFDDTIHHYLNLTRIEQGNLKIEPRSILVVHDVVQPCLENLDRQITTKKIKVVNELPPGDIRLVADPALLRIVFNNLLNNAIVYGREGGTVRLSAFEHGGWWEFSVWNEGVGIPKNKIKPLFRKFNRGENPSAPKLRGTGLGLYITRTIIERHGGTISADSEEGSWAQFRFTLPAVVSPASGA